jgi:hypothetical protein
MGKRLTHTIQMIRKDGWNGYKDAEVVACRLLKHHIVLEHGTKYNKSDGLMVGALRYLGVYMETTKVKISTLKEKDE